MNKIVSKLIVSILALTVAATLAAMSSYAWLTISGAPEVDGIQVNIGGSNTIMVAADMVTIEDDGSIHHYPGEFSQDLNFLQYDAYSHLQSLAGLSPVSTSDGVYWFLADYYDAEDSYVQSGLAVDGQIKDISQFLTDRTLSYANLSAEETEDAATGSYVYLDFWVVSPADGYKLRVSTGGENEDSGSYVISLMEPSETDEDGDGVLDSYVLADPDQTAAASIRVGFLVNQDFAKYGDRVHYYSSNAYDARYTHLMGQYQESGEDISLYAAAQNCFTIYEPNADLHPADSDGYYQITKPLGMLNGSIAATDVGDIVTAQKSSLWRMTEGGMDTRLEQEFQTVMVTEGFRENVLQEIFSLFYRDRLQGQLAHYIKRGWFVRSTAALYDAADPKTGIVEQDALALKDTAGATDDVYITTLQKDVPQRIRMFIWIEGQDADCSNHISASSFAVNIELAGSNNG